MTLNWEIYKVTDLFDDNNVNYALSKMKPDIPAMLVEFKYEKTAATAMTQIINRNYPDRLLLYKENLILVGINYDKTISSTDIEYKHHSCEIRKA